MGLLDSILGGFNSSEIGGVPTDRMISTTPPSGSRLPCGRINGSLWTAR